MFVPRVVFGLLFLAAITTTSHAQAIGTGFPLFNSFARHEVDIINEGNLNVHLEIPIFAKSGRGLPVNYVISYDTLNWYEVLNPTNNVYYWTWAGTGWHVASQPVAGYITYDEINHQYACNGNGLVQRINYIYYDPSGGTHFFNTVVTTEADCYGVSHGWSSPVSAGDGFGYLLSVDDSLAVIITTADGKLIHPFQEARNTAQGGSNANPVLPGVITDSNGNQINNLAQEDTLGVPALQLNCIGVFQCTTVTYPSPTNPSNFVGATFNYTQMTIQSHFSCGWILEGGNGFQNMLTSITLPDSSQYRFTYEQTNGYPAGNTTGRIASLTLPSGEYITYQYTGINNGIICADGSVAGLTRTTPDGSWTYTRTVTQQTPSTVTSSITQLIDPMGNKQVINFGKGDRIEAMRQIYTGSSTLVKTIETCYEGAPFPCTNTTGTGPLEKAVREEFPDSSGQVSEVDTFHTTVNGARLPTDVWEDDFGSAAPGPLIRHTHTTYAGPFTANIFYDPNNPSTSYSTTISNRPASVTVYDGGGSTASQTTYAYDETTPTSITGTPSHVPNTGSRGNPTTITQVVQGTTTIHRTKTYYDTGMLSTQVDANGNPPTTYTYGTGSCGNAFPTQVTNAIGFNTLFSWDCNGGVMTGTTDPNNIPNNQPTSYSWTDPNYWRLTQINYPDGGQKTATYNTASTPWNIVQTTKINGTQTLTTKTIYDSLARVSQQQLTSDPDGTTYTDTTYDADGRLKSVSNPYRSGSDSTYGITSYLYDGLGRVTSTTEPDGSVVGTSYSANQTTVTDEAGKQRKTQVDGLGRLTAVWEAPNISGYNYETDYQYNALDNLLCAVQKATDTSPFTTCAAAPATWRPRSFQYDSLSRITSAANPESGTISYTYDSNGNLKQKTSPKPDQSNPATTTNINYCYDALNRVTSKAYNTTACPPASAAATYSYDQGTNGIGHRTGMTDGPGSATWVYDLMGRVKSETRVTANVTKTTSYVYNLDGSVQSVTYPSTHTVNYTYSAAGRALSAIDPAGPTNYVTSATYAPPGELVTATNGFVQGGFTGINTANVYSKRLQPVLLSATNPTATVLSLCYDFHSHTALNYPPCNFSASTAGDNGNVYQIANNRDGNRTQNFLYDSLNRVQQAYTNGPNWGETFGPIATNPGTPPSSPGIDAWGNLTNRSAVIGKTFSEGLNCPANINNQLATGCLTYDAAGNVTWDGSLNYLHDLENRMTKFVGSTTDIYVYDGDGQRVKKTTPAVALYWYGATGNVLDETSGNGTLVSEYIFFNGKRVARRDADNSVKYYFADNLGSASVITNDHGAMTPPLAESDYYPYGGEIPITSGDPNHYKFTGKERDSESGLDNFGARYNASSLGRFMSPDPIGIMRQKLSDPQQWNMYAYTRNNPLRFMDATGMSNTDNTDCSTKLGRCSRKIETNIQPCYYQCQRWTENQYWAQNKKTSWWPSLTGTVAAGMARISPAAARKLWEAANPGQKVPFDAIRGRFYDMAHIKPIADGGASAAAENLKPQEHGEHMAEHMANGDFARWGARAKDAVVDAAKAAGREIESDARSSANEMVQDVKEAATEIIHNPGEAVREAATAVVEAEESGELPPP
jgi:RHS repeat-associated protein